MKQGENPWFRVLGGVAIVNVLVILGLLAWLRVEGRLDVDRVQQIAAVLQPTQPTDDVEPEPPKAGRRIWGIVGFCFVSQALRVISIWRPTTTLSSITGSG